jgi:hypothetical protein
MAYVTSKTGMSQRAEEREGEPEIQKPRPGTRWAYVNRAAVHDPNGEHAMRVTLPAEPWHVEGGA